MFISSSTFSQSIHFGLKGGINRTSLTGPEAPSLSDYKLSYNFGAFINQEISYIASVRYELHLTSKKFAFSRPIDFLENATLDAAETNSYLTLPVLFTFRTGDNVLNGFVNFGPEAAFLIRHQRDLTAVSNGLEISAEPYYNYNVYAYDFGLSAGGGLQIRNFILDTRAFLSLHPLYSDKDSPENRYVNWYVNLSYIINYRPPRDFSRTNAWKQFKYNLKHLF